MNKWWIVLRLKTANKFNKNQADFDNNNTILRGCKIYLQNTQLLDHKTYFIKAQTDQLLHLGAVDSSQVEGAHRTLKCYIKL